MRTTTARGGASGAVGVVAMDVATWPLYRRESRLDLLREKRLRPYGKDTAQALVRRVSTGPQRDDPWQAHARGIVGHVVLGLVTKTTLNAVDGDSSR